MFFLATSHVKVSLSNVWYSDVWFCCWKVSLVWASEDVTPEKKALIWGKVCFGRMQLRLCPWEREKTQIIALLCFFSNAALWNEVFSHFHTYFRPRCDVLQMYILVHLGGPLFFQFPLDPWWMWSILENRSARKKRKERNREMSPQKVQIKLCCVASFFPSSPPIGCFHN